MQRTAGFVCRVGSLALSLTAVCGFLSAPLHAADIDDQAYDLIQPVHNDCSAQPSFDYWNRPYQPYSDSGAGAQTWTDPGTSGSMAGSGGLGGQGDSAFASGLEGGAIGNPNSIAASATPFGYIDMAAPVTMFRERYDDALNSNFPDRGEYLYAQCGCFNQLGITPTAGPPGANRSVDFQTLSSYLEYAFSPRFSVFAYLPVQWVGFNAVPDSELTGANAPLRGTSPGSTSGFADMHAGFKYALIANPDQYLTFQLRTYIPTGDSVKGLGTDHVSIESGLLYYQRLSENWLFQAEVKEWTPINVSSFASNVFQYGIGVGYILVRAGNIVVTPTFETVGWTFIGGQQFNPDTGLESADGTTIVNVKPGVRVGLSDLDAPSGQQRHSVYFGWGHPITGERLYKDIFRVEYRWIF